MAHKAEIHQLESLDEFPLFAYRVGWTDGLPVYPRTRLAVQAILDYLGRDPAEVLGAVFPGDGEATIENVAANCVMAGCLPEHVPVVLAAVECIVDPTLLITTTQSTGSASICTLVTGPLVGTLGFHTREWIFGPNGGRSNGTMGHPASWSYCIGEDQELNPWAPMHADLGIAAGESAVTVMKAGEHTQLAVPLNSVGLNECITLLARGIGRLGVTSSGGKRGFLFVLNPTLAQAFAQAGYSREKLRDAIAGRAWKYSYDWQNDRKQGNAVPFPEPGSKTPSERDVVVAPIEPDEIFITVGGGVAPQMGQCVAIASRNSAGKPMLTKTIRLPG